VIAGRKKSISDFSVNYHFRVGAASSEFKL